MGPGPEPGRERSEVDKQLRPHPSEWEAAFERSGKNVGGSVPGRTGHAQAPQDGRGREAGRGVQWSRASGGRGKGGEGAGQGDGLSPGMVTLPHTCVTLSRGPAPPTSETYKEEKQEPNGLPAVARAPRLAGLMA